MNPATASPPKQAAPPPLKTETLQQLLAAHLPAREALLAPWLRQGDSAMVYAPTGLGKSLFALSLSLAIAGGGKFLGWSAPKPRRVLFIDGEMPRADIMDRANLLLPAHPEVDGVAAGQNLCFLARQGQHMDARFPDLGADEGQQVAAQLVRSHRADLVVLDNFSTLAEVEDENSAAAFNGIVRFLMRLKQAGTACVLVHHSGKTGRDFRGSSKLSTTFEVLIGLTRPETPRKNNAPAFNLEWAKYRGERDGSISGRAVWLDKEANPPAWNFETSDDERLNELVAAVRSCQYSTQAQLAEALHVSAGYLSKLKAKAIFSKKLIGEHDCGIL